MKSLRFKTYLYKIIVFLSHLHQNKLQNPNPFNNSQRRVYNYYANEFVL